MKSGILEHSDNEKVDALCSVCGITPSHEATLVVSLLRLIR